MSKQTELAQLADAVTVSSGNVGIGTSSPSAKLEIDSKTAGEYGPTVIVDSQAGTAKLRITDDSNNSATTRMAISHNYNRTSSGYSADTTSKGVSQIGFYDGDIRIETAPAGSSGPTERMRIDSSGKIGIGTSSPQACIQIDAAKFADPITNDAKILFTEGAGPACSLFYNGSAGGGTANKFHIRSEITGQERNILSMDMVGRIRMPYQPMFDVSTNTSDARTGDLAYTYVHHNVGSNYSTSTGRFTAPVDGYYEFSATIIKNNIPNTVTRLYLKKNGTISMENRHLRMDVGQAYGDNGFMFWTLFLSAGDYAQLNCGAGEIYNGSREYSHFRGRLIG